STTMKASLGLKSVTTRLAVAGLGVLVGAGVTIGGVVGGSVGSSVAGNWVPGTNVGTSKLDDGLTDAANDGDGAAEKPADGGVVTSVGCGVAEIVVQPIRPAPRINAQVARNTALPDIAHLLPMIGYGTFIEAVA